MFTPLIQEVVMSEETAVQELPSLRVIINDTGPQFSFSGSWTGKDLGNISRLLQRAYKSYTRDRRRGIIKEE
jgi:hypothetical protein